MANQSTTGFGLRPIRKVGQNDNNAGLGEFQIASGATAIYHHDLVLLAGTGYITVGSASPNVNNVGSLNGVYYVDPTTSKPTWSNYWPSVAVEADALVNSDPQQMFELRTASATPGRGSIGGTADIVYTAGASPNYISRITMSGTVGTSISNPIKVIGISRDPLNQDTSVAGCVYRVMINAHILGNNVAGI
jgi:hypothetical protein